MKPLIFFLLIITGIALSQCNKNNHSDNESFLYGTWVKGNNTGDTLTFVKKNGKNVLLYNMSFNPGFSAPTETEYSYRNGKLAIRFLGSGDFRDVDNFNWKELGKEFELEGTDLFPFMALYTVTFTYRKI